MSTQIPSLSDQEELINDSPNLFFKSVSKPFFIVCHLLPIALGIIWCYIHCNPAIPLFVTVIIELVKLYYTKEYFGLGLVGLKWYFDKTEQPSFPHIVYYSRPLPFVPATFDSNLFWIMLLTSSITSIILTIVYFMVFGWRMRILAIIITVINFWNVSAFMKCHNAGKEQADSVARTLLLDTNVSFHPAKEFDEQSSSEEEEEIPDNAENDDDIY